MPLFSIGVTTYNRKELLTQTLKSILDQTFTDFEVLVGNDYTEEELSGESLGINDSRIRFINYPQNLGEAGNMNTLLERAQGKYFTWQFDDDIYSPNFLEEVHSAIINHHQLQCVYTSHGWIWGDSYPRLKKKYNGVVNLYTGKAFIKLFLSGKIKTAGCCGVFEINTLRNIGGILPLSKTPIAIHSEFLLLVQTSMFDRIVFINSPLFFSRDYEGTFSGSTTDAKLYKTAGVNLIRETIKIIHQSALKDEFQLILNGIIEIVIKHYIMRYVGKEGDINHQQIREFMFEIRKLFNTLKNTTQYELALESWSNLVKKKWIITVFLAKVKWNSPHIINKYIKLCRSFL